MPVSTKEVPKTAYPKTLLSIIASAGGLALFLIIASTSLLSQPLGSTFHGYFNGIDSSREVDPEVISRTGSKSNHIVDPFEDQGKSNLTVNDGHKEVIPQPGETTSAKSGTDDAKGTLSEDNRNPVSQDKDESLDTRHAGFRDSVDKPPRSKEEVGGNEISPFDTALQVNESSSSNNTQTGVNKSMESSVDNTNSSQAIVVDSDCDLYHGRWIHDSTGPLYTNNSCPIITEMQNCQGNGRPDKDYENWRWKPSQCDLPKFDAKKFLELMRGKTLAFIGDSVARNQMESLLCILWQVEVPKNRGNRNMHRYYFRSTSTMIVRIWSSWLIHQSSEPFDFAPAGVSKLHLDVPDKIFTQYITDFNVIVLSSGHWFAKPAAYILNNEIVGGQIWWPDKSRQMKIDIIKAYGVSTDTILTALGTHPNYTGITIVRSFSPDHYEGGAWNTGGSCTGKVRPVLEGELVENGFTNRMHEQQVAGFNRSIKKKTNKSKLRLMDITEAFSYRHDGHPGPYRSPDPNKIIKRGPDGKPPPQDCLHWCMPGPIDTWNELLFEIIRREFS